MSDHPTGGGTSDPCTAEQIKPLNLALVTVTTRADEDKPSTGGQTYTRKLLLYYPGKPCIGLLPEDWDGSTLEPEAIVFLADIDAVEVVKTWQELHPGA